MIISRGRRYIFVHAPKTGGTSLALALENRAMRDDIMLGDTPKAKKRRRHVKDVETSGRLWKHAQLCDIVGLVSEAEIRDFFIFTIVRNPWDRLVSYYHWAQQQSFAHPTIDRAKQVDFSHFIRDPLVANSFSQSGYTSYVTTQAGEERCDLYLKLETINRDILTLEQKLNLKLSPLPHENRSDRQPDYRQYYSDADAQLVGQLCRDDIERFNYQF